MENDKIDLDEIKKAVVVIRSIANGEDLSDMSWSAVSGFLRIIESELAMRDGCCNLVKSDILVEYLAGLNRNILNLYTTTNQLKEQLWSLSNGVENKIHTIKQEAEKKS